MKGRATVGITAHVEAVVDGGSRVDHYMVASGYVRAVARAGAVPVLLPVVRADDVNDLLDRVDGVIITGGCDVDPANYGRVREPGLGDVDPLRDERDLAVARAVVARNQPALAICRGVQVLNVAVGGTLVQHLDDHMNIDRYNDIVHEITIAPDSVLADIVGDTSLGVNTLHHQVIDLPGPRARVVARDPHGHPEAIEITDAPNVLGVQWHPELLRHLPQHLALFRWVGTLAT